jgi:hypothetical protein
VPKTGAYLAGVNPGFAILNIVPDNGLSAIFIGYQLEPEGDIRTLYCARRRGRCKPVSISGKPVYVIWINLL